MAISLVESFNSHCLVIVLAVKQSAYYLADWPTALARVLRGNSRTRRLRRYSSASVEPGGQGDTVKTPVKRR